MQIIKLILSLSIQIMYESVKAHENKKIIFFHDKIFHVFSSTPYHLAVNFSCTVVRKKCKTAKSKCPFVYVSLSELLSIREMH